MNDSQSVEQTRADEMVIDNLETLKVLADQLRKRIMEQFDEPSTVKEVARKLGTSPSKLYYHVNLLEEHGLLKVTDTRIVSGIIYVIKHGLMWRDALLQSGAHSVAATFARG